MLYYITLYYNILWFANYFFLEETIEILTLFFIFLFIAHYWIIHLDPY